MPKLSTDIEREIADRTRSLGYSSEEELLRAALGALDERNEIETRLSKAMNSGNRIPVTPEYWEQKRRELLARQPDRKL